MAEALRPSEFIQSLLTPQDLLGQTHLPSPEAIQREKYPTFESLLAERERIRTLSLLPVRKPEKRILYQSQPPEQLRNEVESYLEGLNFALRRDPYPYDLPPDVGQHIIWLKDKDTPPQAISEFIANSLGIMNRKPDEIILFEKSHTTQTEIARGTFPHRRHIHLLVERANNPTFPAGRQVNNSMQNNK